MILHCSLVLYLFQFTFQFEEERSLLRLQELGVFILWNDGGRSWGWRGGDGDGRLGFFLNERVDNLLETFVAHVVALPFRDLLELNLLSELFVVARYVEEVHGEYHCVYL